MSDKKDETPLTPEMEKLLHALAKANRCPHCGKDVLGYDLAAHRNCLFALGERLAEAEAALMKVRYAKDHEAAVDAAVSYFVLKETP